MDNNISERIELIINKLGYNYTSFSKAIGLSNNVTINRIVKEKRQPSYEVLYLILKTFGSINANWLIKGDGDMSIQKDQVITCNDCIYKKIAERYDRDINRYEKIIDSLTKQLDSLNDNDNVSRKRNSA